MSNPARDIADLFEKWAEHAEERTIIGARAPGANRATTALWVEMRRAIELLFAFESRVDQLEAAGANVAHYRSLISPMYQAIFAPDVTWSAAKSAIHGTVTAERRSTLRIAADAWSNITLDRKSVV